MMRSVVRCTDFPCADVAHDRYLVPAAPDQPDRVSVVLISEAPPADPCDDYYAPGDPLFAQTTVAAFNEAGVSVADVTDILDLGVYLTTAIKAVNTIAVRAGCGRAIPAGSTYKIRGGEYVFNGIRLFPSYLQAGPSYFIEKSKREVIAEDIAAALRFVGTSEAQRPLP